MTQHIPQDIAQAYRAERDEAQAESEKLHVELARLRAVNAELVTALDRITFAFGQKEKRGDDYLVLMETRAVLAKAIAALAKARAAP